MGFQINDIDKMGFSLSFSHHILPNLVSNSEILLTIWIY